jgi:hypothetical protein
MTVAIAGNIPLARIASPDETADDKARLDEEFQKKTVEIKQQLARAEAFTPWIYEADHWLEMVVHKRSDLLVKKTTAGEQAAAQ